MSAMQIPLEPELQSMVDNGVMTRSEAEQMQHFQESIPEGAWRPYPQHLQPAAWRQNLFHMPPANRLPL